MKAFRHFVAKQGRLFAAIFCVFCLIPVRAQSVLNAGAGNGMGITPSSPQIPAMVTDGVDWQDGTLSLSFPELYVPDHGIPLRFVLYYSDNSATLAWPQCTTAAPCIGVGSGLPAGWSDNYSMQVAQTQTRVGNGVMVTEKVEQENGTVDVFGFQNGGTFNNGGTVATPNPGPLASPPFSLATLTLEPTGLFTFYRQHEGITYYLSGHSQGVLLFETDRNGYTTSLQYMSDSNGNPIGAPVLVTDPENRKLTFGYSQIAFAGGSVSVLTSVADPAGRSIRLQYNDGQGNLTDIFHVNGNKTHLVYNSEHVITQITDPNGNVTNYNRCTTAGTTSGLGSCSTFTANLTMESVTKLTGGAQVQATQFYLQPGESSITDGAGNITAVAYGPPNANGIAEPISLTRGVSTWKYSYDQAGQVPAGSAMGLVTQVQDANGNLWKSTYDQNANLTKTVDPLGRSNSAAYNQYDEPTSVTDGNQITTQITYDTNGNLKTVSRPNTTTGRTQTTAYYYCESGGESVNCTGDDAPGQVTMIQDADGVQTLKAYDVYGDLTSITDGAGNQTTNSRDIIGRKTSTVSPKGTAFVPGNSLPTPKLYTTTYSYKNPQDSNPLGSSNQVTVQTDPLGHSRGWIYDGNGNVTAESDGDGNLTTYTYNAVNEVVTEVRPDKVKLYNYYFQDGSLHYQLDGLGNPTSYAYDNQGRLSQTGDSDLRVTTYGYDNNGNRTSLTNPKGGVTSYGYDAANQITSITYSDPNTPSVTSITYDGTGKRKTMVVPKIGGGASWSYDSLNRLASTTDSLGMTVQYGYTLGNRLSEVLYPSGLEVDYTYGDAGRMKTANLKGSAASFHFLYDSNGNLQAMYYPNGALMTSSYSPTDEVTQIVHANGVTISNMTGTPFSILGYGNRDGNDQLLGRSDAGTFTDSESFHYDNLNQLHSNSGSPYLYDAVGNLTQTVDGTVQAFDAAGQLCWTQVGNSASKCLTVPGGATTYSYDLNGRRITMTPPSGSPVSYSYDEANRLIGYSGSVAAVYAYNGDGLRIAKQLIVPSAPQQVAGYVAGETLYTWGSSAQLLEENTGMGSTDYIYGPNGMLLAQVAPSGVQYFYHLDNLGGVHFITDANGRMQAGYEYTPYGNLLNNAPPSSFGYAGQYTDAESGLLYMRARYYDPTTGQFLTVDPKIASTHTPYGYAGDSPVNFTDPSGEICWSCDFKHAEHAVGHVAESAVRSIADCAMVGSNLSNDVTCATTVASIAILVATDGAATPLLMAEGGLIGAAGEGANCLVSPGASGRKCAEAMGYGAVAGTAIAAIPLDGLAGLPEDDPGRFVAPALVGATLSGATSAGDPTNYPKTKPKAPVKSPSATMLDGVAASHAAIAVANGVAAGHGATAITQIILHWF